MATNRATATPPRDYAAIAARYENDVLSGRVLACQEVIAACQRNRDDLGRASTPERPWPYHYDPAKGARPCKFLEQLRHIKGEAAGKLVVLEPSTVWAVMTLYGWVRPDGRRRFSRGYYEVARGNAKSLLSSGLGLFHLCADGDEGAEVYAAATTQKQARIVWDTAKAMARMCPALVNYYGVKLWAHSINVPRTESKFVAVCAKGETQDGYNVSLAILDELHAHKRRELYDVMETGCGKRPGSLLWCITTAGTDRSGICYEVRSYVRDVLMGRVIDDNQFGIIYTLDPTDDWRDPGALVKANPLWGVSVIPDKVLELQRKAIATPSAVNNFKTKHCNIWCSAGNAFIDMQAWDALADPGLRIEDYLGRPCWIGVDLASKRDVASVALVFKDGERRVLFLRHYLNQQAIDDGANSAYAGWAEQGHLIVNPGPVTDHTRIEDDLMDDLQRFSVRQVGYDPNNATLLAQRLSGYTDVVEVRQSVAGMSEPTKALDAAIRKGVIAHAGDPVTSWMCSNVRVTVDKKDNVFPFKARPEEKIDGFIAAVMALSRANAETDDEDDNFNQFIGLTTKQHGDGAIRNTG